MNKYAAAAGVLMTAKDANAVLKLQAVLQLIRFECCKAKEAADTQTIERYNSYEM